jgi:DNA polymerase III epsilon subunit-like protein
MDLEWNQSNTGLEKEAESLPFEIIEIGAIKLNDSGVMLNEFSQLIKPQVYKEMHQMTGKLLHLQMQELRRGKPFDEAAREFLDWCGEEYLFCTWGSLDLTELQRNMKFYGLEPLSDGPIAFLDVQKLFSLAFEDGKSRRALEAAVDIKRLEKDIPFHRAFSDAYYTSKLFQMILAEKPEVLKKLSYDVYHLPKDRESEVKVQFDTYEKYISREFDSKADAFADREVSSSKCYLCHRNLRKKIKWFTPNGRHYFCLAHCEKHGYLKGKIRLRKSESGKVYVVKTMKLISDREAQSLNARRLHAKETKMRHGAE